MKKILLSAVFLAASLVYCHAEKDPENTQDTYEQLKKEYEAIRHNPESRAHTNWIARCYNNNECKKECTERLKKIPQDKLVDDYFKMASGVDAACSRMETRFEKIAEDTADIIKEFNTNVQTINHVQKLRKKLDLTFGIALSGCCLLSLTLIYNSDLSELTNLIVTGSIAITTGSIGILLILLGYKKLI